MFSLMLHFLVRFFVLLLTNYMQFYTFSNEKSSIMYFLPLSFVFQDHICFNHDLTCAMHHGYGDSVGAMH